MTDWNTFTTLVQELIANYSDSKLKELVAYIDPAIWGELTLKERLLIRTGITSKPKGRDICYANLFRHIQPPPEAMEAYNSLIAFLFTPDTARSVVTAKIVEAKKEIQTSEVRRQKLALLVQSLPPEPPAYLQPLQQPEAWKTLYEQASNPDASWDDALKAASILATAKTEEAAVEKFKGELKTLPTVLYQSHVAAIGPFIEEILLAGASENEIAQFLQQQKESLTDLEEFRKKQQEWLNVHSAPFMQKLFTPQLLPYPDLSNEIKRLVTMPFEYAPRETLDLEAYKGDIKQFYEAQAAKIAHLLDAAEARVKKLQEMSEYSKIFFTVTEPASHFKDIQQDYLTLEDKVKSLALDKEHFSEATFEETEKKLTEKYSLYLKVKQEMPTAVVRLLKGAHKSEHRAEDDKAAIKRRLFEIFWNISPYLDLMENFQDMRKVLTSQLKEGMRKFYAGTLSSHELLQLCQEMPYEHDVVKLRNEITHRSARLKDLRDELLRLTSEVQETIRLLDIANLESVELLKLSETIRTIARDVENPFKAFAEAETKDAINLVFRKFWIRIEEIQPLIEEAQAVANHELQHAAVPLKDALLRALDTLEEVQALKSGTRPQIVSRIAGELVNPTFNLVISYMHSIEKSYSFVKPLSFFMAVREHKARLAMLQEAEVLDRVIKDTIDFAKAMQYVKTFEEERVDIILEAFERQHIIEPTWESYYERMNRAARLVEDEIFLDIGLLDRHALMDVDEKELNKTLHIAISRAKKHIYEPKYGIQASIQDVRAFEVWANAVVDDSKSTDWLLEHLRNYCHMLFDAKIILAARGGMLLPKCLQFINEVRALTVYQEAILQKKRNLNVAEWGPEWIPECQDMRCEIECFEPEEESADALRPLLKKFQSTFADVAEDKIAHLNKRLEEIEGLSKNPKKECPFIYIPGYIAFFDMEYPAV
ncbi:MAG: hypothetical protein JSR37_06150 [Verrucomicrobia bacterium]|nr:hypothetical protein [Verrucomicrobiota bacterium]MBS0636587.1 hypothetical protein [Verrucomicrobiota bacterium]